MRSVTGRGSGTYSDCWLLSASTSVKTVTPLSSFHSAFLPSGTVTLISAISIICLDQQFPSHQKAYRSEKRANHSLQNHQQPSYRYIHGRGHVHPQRGGFNAGAPGRGFAGGPGNQRPNARPGAGFGGGKGAGGGKIFTSDGPTSNKGGRDARRRNEERNSQILLL